MARLNLRQGFEEDASLRARAKTFIKGLGAKVQVNTYPNFNSVVARSKHGAVEAVYRYPPGGKKVLKVVSSSLRDKPGLSKEDALKARSVADIKPVGRGHGVVLYHALAKHALAQGVELQSDSCMTKHACRAWEALRDRGHDVRLHPGSKLDPVDGGRLAAKDSECNYYIPAPAKTGNRK